MSSGGSNLEVPVSPGARAVRLALVLVIDLVMLGAGAYLIKSGLDDRRQVSEPAIEALKPSRVVRGSATATAGPPAAAGATAPSSSPPSKGPAKSAVAAKTKKRAPRLAAARKRKKTGGGTAAAAPDKVSEAKRTPPASATEESGGSAEVDEESPVSGDDAVPEPAPETTGADIVDSAPPPEAAANEASNEEVEQLARQVARVVERNRSSLTRCYERAAKGPGVAEPLAGQIEVRLTVLPGGFAANVRPVSNDTGSDVLASCLVSLVRSWQFPAHGFDPIEFVWPFVFHAPNSR